MGLEAKSAGSGTETLVFPVLGCHGSTYDQRSALREPKREAQDRQLRSMTSAGGELQKR
jgi:hypothetical protein